MVNEFVASCDAPGAPECEVCESTHWGSEADCEDLCDLETDFLSGLDHGGRTALLMFNLRVAGIGDR